MFKIAFIFVTFFITMNFGYGQSIKYQSPPDVINDLIDVDPTPGVSLSPDRKTMLMLQPASLPGIQEVSQKELRIGGLRINPQTNGGSRGRYYVKLTLKDLTTNETREVSGLPDHTHIENLSWSPKSNRVVFTRTSSKGLQLWMLDVEAGEANQLTEGNINDAISGIPYVWHPDGNRIVATFISEDRGDAPRLPDKPAGPVVQENESGAAPVRTYQDLLSSPHDEALFEYYTTGELALVDLGTGASHPLNIQGIISDLDLSPDGKYLLIERIQKPYSYIVPYYRFAHQVDLYDLDGQLVKNVAKLPAAEKIPKGFNAVAEGPRNFSWRADAPATLYWVEAQDGGDPNKEAEVRDQLFLWQAPFQGKPLPSITFSLRYRGITWGDGTSAIASESWWSTRQQKISHWAPDENSQAKTILFDRSYEDRYTDPGSFATTRNEVGRSVLLMNGDGHLYLTGLGASEEGNRPFVDRYDPAAKTSERLWRSEAPFYEIPVTIIDQDNGTILTRRESKDAPPNFFFRNLKNGALTQITHFTNPYESLKNVKKELIHYQRADGIELTGTLYTPPGYDASRDGRLPVLMWAYPREYKSKDAASQVRNSPYEFLRIYYGSPIFWALRGYAVFDNFAMPIIGEGDTEPNQTFVPQLVQGAQAAINKIVELGVADPKRIGVGGHSYGAFMTANLLAHCDLFAAGIARSGAYNRTLTPFGFQSEQRTYWEAPDVYNTMSPFMHANKIREPLLMLHGEADNNSGTYPMQSERFYAALKGHGATVRLVMLPHESHGYRAKESILHMLWEMDQWLEKYVKNRNTETISH